MSTVAKKDAEVVPSLAELAAIARREHQAVKSSYGSALRHAILCGEALLSAHQQIPYGEWTDWLRDNMQEFGVTAWITAFHYMRIAEFRKDIEASGVTTQVAAQELLKTLGRKRDQHSKYDHETRAAVAARYALGGISISQLSRELGIAQGTLGHWIHANNPVIHAHRQKLNRESAARQRARRKRERLALIRQERDAAAKKAGGGVSEAYSQIRKLSQVLDSLGRDGSSVEMRAAANEAMRYLHRMEDAIVKALPLS